MATILPLAVTQFFDAQGTPLEGGSVYFYIPGTTTPKNTWQDSGGTILNTNPVVLNAAGEALIYGTGSYRQVVYDSAGNLVWDQLTADTSVGGLAWGGTSTGTPNAQVIAASSFSQQDGQQISFIVGTDLTNTGATTVAPGGGSGIAVLKDTQSGPTALTGGELVAGNAVSLLYDATRGAFHLVETPQINMFGGPLTPIASASTTNLGSVPSHNISVTGTTTINSFGASATTDNPLYQVTFTGSLTLTYNGTTMVLPGAANITTAPYDTALVLYLGSGNWRVLSYYRGAVAPIPRPFNAGQLQYTSTTSVTLMPFNGNQVAFPSSAIAIIPSSGISSAINNASVNGVAAQTLSPTTLYYAYLWNNGTSYVIDWSTTGHATDAATGIEIRSGDPTRVLIGMAYPLAGPVFSSSNTSRLVSSWFNRSAKPMINKFSANRTTTSTTFVEINSEIRLNVLSWGDAIVSTFAGEVDGTAGSQGFVAIAVDGILSSPFQSTAFNASSASVSGSISTVFGMTEGFHYLTLMGATSTGTLQFSINGLETPALTAMPVI